jgi:RNA polymerase sigma-70 factor (ECF subfamily)
VFATIYLVFNAGYGPPVRRELCGEAIRLAAVLATLMPDEAEAHGLHALLLLQDARRDARVSPTGELVLLDEQDRGLWDADGIEQGRRALDRALSLRRPGPYQLQAAIAALHVQAPRPAERDWRQIAALYDALARHQPSPVVEVNRAVAVSHADGAQAGLDLLAPLLDEARLEGYQPLHAAHAELLRQAGDATGAARAYEKAIALALNPVERAELERRLVEIARPAPSN